MSRQSDDKLPEVNASGIAPSADAGPDLTSGAGAAIDPERVGRALESIGIPLSRSEAHGLACGLLCAETTAAAKSRWFTELIDAAELDAGAVAAHGESIRVIDAWFVATQEQLDAPDVVFSPVLPPDDAPFGMRIDALGDFCAGFTYGVGIGVSSRGNRALPDDSRELLADFQAIDGVERGTRDDAGSGSDGAADNEADYAELVEYVRVGVLVILEELKPVDRVAAGKERATSDTPGATSGSTDFSRLH